MLLRTHEFDKVTAVQVLPEKGPPPTDASKAERGGGGGHGGLALFPLSTGSAALQLGTSPNLNVPYLVVGAKSIAPVMTLPGNNPPSVKKFAAARANACPSRPAKTLRPAHADEGAVEEHLQASRRATAVEHRRDRGR
jgi:hypothetical protein